MRQIVWFVWIVPVLFVQTVLSEKLCRFRDDEPLYPPDVWMLVTGFYCYSYTNATTRLIFRYNTTKHIYSSGDNDYNIRKFQYEGAYYAFNYTDETAMTYLSYSFRTPTLFEIYKICAREAVECCDDYMDDDNIYPDDDYPCPATWDGWSCFPQSQADTISKMPCSSQAYSSLTTVCVLYSEKECFSNGTWNQNTDYTPCAIAPVYRKWYNYHIVILYISIAFSFPAVVVFFSIPKLRTLRVILHRNLLIAIICRNALSIMTKDIVMLDQLKSSAASNQVMQQNSVECRVLAFFENVSKNAIYATMMVDGFYLHKMVVRVFAKDPTFVAVYGVVTGLSVVPALVWALLKGLYSNELCWMVEENGYQWANDSIRLLVLCFNMLLLLDIIRVLLMKLRRNTTAEHAKYSYSIINIHAYANGMKAALQSTLRATLFLMPLFGLHMLFVINRNIAGDTCSQQDYYYYISYTMEGLQGVLVALCFCYLNSEVHREMKNIIRKCSLYISQRFGVNFGNTPQRRRTDATYVRSSIVQKHTDNLPANLQTEPKNKVEDWLTSSQDE